jgi:glycosyltransferase involved in cell wall biosynthesis
MRIGFISTRFNGTDGVSLETEKWSLALEKMGHEIFYCAGELGGYSQHGTLIPQMHFAHQTAFNLSQRAFGPQTDESPDAVIDEIYEVSDEIKRPLRKFIRENRLDLIVVQNALTIPMNLPLGVCLTGLIAELGINTIAHHHDFYWERQRYQVNDLINMLDTAFPAKLPTVQHVTINTIAQRRLKSRRGIDSVVVPNVHDFNTPPPGIDSFNKDFRKELGLSPDDLFVLQATRVIRRKGIELALMLLKRMELEAVRLFITHSVQDEGLNYWRWLSREAQVMGVDLQLITDRVGPVREKVNEHKIYSLWDVYPHVDLVTYPSTYEGFGNGLLEAVYFKKLTVVNKYPVYMADIQPLGFEFLELDGFVNDGVVQEILHLLDSPKQVEEMVEHNFKIAQEHFSLNVLEQKLDLILNLF